jgi:UDP-N-acetylmuramoyl-tripeptide--D-alanyl-D-alanine ligase
LVRWWVFAITGSVGKSTTKECLAAILSAHGPTLKTLHNQNDDAGVPRTLRALRPWHRYAVIEVATGEPGTMLRLARLVRPDIAIVLAVARTHTNEFATLEATAAEKARLVDYASRRGAVILNGDDARVRRMAARSRAKVVLVGSTEDCDLRAENANSAWPERLRFDVRCGAQTIDVRTRLVGTHWVASALASLAAARACGVPLAAAARALGEVAPFAGRMQPVTLPSGAVVIRDEENGSPDTLDAMVKVMAESRAQRRVLVFSDVSDVKANSRKRLRDVGALVGRFSDVAIFVGEHGHHAVTTAVAAGMDPASCHHVPELEKAAELLGRQLRAGDVAFVKGRSTHHLSRIVFAQLGPIECWTTSCKIKSLCDLCPKLRPAFDLERVLADATGADGSQ